MESADARAIGAILCARCFLVWEKTRAPPEAKYVFFLFCFFFFLIRRRKTCLRPRMYFSFFLFLFFFFFFIRRRKTRLRPE
jgi:hypothetical protein